MKPGYIAFGKYKEKRMTLEEVCFRDFQYVDWILSEFEAGHWAVKHLRQLFKIARSKPVIGPCEGDRQHKTNCGRMPNTFSIPTHRDDAYVRGAWRICSDSKCQREVFSHAGAGLALNEISFEGFRDFVSVFATKGEATDFALELAKAWGIVREDGKLTKRNIFAFFDVEA